MGRVGFLPENPYVYPYLTPREFVSLCGRLNGMGGSKLARRRPIAGSCLPALVGPQCKLFWVFRPGG